MNQWPSRATRMLPLPFSTTCAFRLLDSMLRRLDAVGLHVGGRARRAGAPASAGCGVSSVSALAARAGLAQVRVLGDEVERIGVEHARHVARQRGADQRLGALALAEARPDDERVEVLAERIVRMAQHQLRA